MPQHITFTQSIINININVNIDIIMIYPLVLMGSLNLGESNCTSDITENKTSDMVWWSTMVKLYMITFYDPLKAERDKEEQENSSTIVKHIPFIYPLVLNNNCIEKKIDFKNNF